MFLLIYRMDNEHQDKYDCKQRLPPKRLKYFSNVLQQELIKTQETMLLQMNLKHGRSKNYTCLHNGFLQDAVWVGALILPYTVDIYQHHT